MKMKKWLKYSCAFALIPAVAVPVVVLSSCGGDKKDDKKDNGNTSTPDDQKPVTTPGNGEKATVNLPILKSNATIKGEAELKRYIEDFNGRTDMSWQTGIIANVIENMGEIESEGKIEKLFLSEIDKVSDGFKLTILLKPNLSFAQINQRSWESAKISYINTKPNEEAPKEDDKDKNAPSEQQSTPKTDQVPETKTVQSASQQPSLVSLVTNGPVYDNVPATNNPSNAEQNPSNTLMPSSSSTSPLQSPSKNQVVDPTTNSQPNSTNDSSSPSRLLSNSTTAEQTNQQVQDNNKQPVRQIAGHQTHAKVASDPRLEDQATSLKTLGSEAIELANEASESISSTNQPNQGESSDQAQLTNQKQEIVNKVNTDAEKTTREADSQSHNRQRRASV